MNKYQLIGEIVALGAIINNNTRNHVFIDFQGHVESLSIRIFLDGWKQRRDADIEERLYADGPDSFKKLNSIKQRLLKMALEGNIDTSKLPYEIETIEIKTYKLLGEAM